MKGRTIIITRPRAQAARLEAAVRRLGARPLVAPAIRIAAPSSWRPLDRALRRLSLYDVLIFTSVNGVEMFFKRARRAGTPRLPRRVFAIGPVTAASARRHGARIESLPDEFEGEALARHLLRRVGTPNGARMLLPRAKVARDALPRLVRRAGARLDVVEAYRTVPDEAGRKRLARAVREGGSPVVTFTSPSTVEQFVGAVGAGRARRFFKTAAAASIGPITSRALRAHGIRPAVEARPFTIQGLAKALRPLAR
ncbi:MAG: uroporphyrinogen-III synthase [Elusimicrobia bacterium]|nr:uroporphyrinogen-III synthase [Elusimicrobiota bacterium]